MFTTKTQRAQRKNIHTDKEDEREFLYPAYPVFNFFVLIVSLW